MPHDLADFHASDMVSCGAALRRACAGAATREEAAGRLVRALHEGLVDPRTGARQCVLVRLYETRTFDELDAPLRAFARGQLHGAPAPRRMRCLVLIAGAGAEAAWSSPETSARHRAIPLASEAMVSRLPMISRLFSGMGVPVRAVVGSARERLELEASNPICGVFHVAEARGSADVPAQEDFVIPYGVRSALGFGGLLDEGRLFAVVLFSNVAVTAEVASLFRTIALSAKDALLSAGAPAGGAPRERAREQLLETLETTSYERFRSLEHALETSAEVERRAGEAGLRRLWESNILGVMVTDVQGTIRDANDAVLHMIGYTREELAAGRVRWRDITPPEYLPIDMRAIAESFERGACTPYEKVYVAKDGRRVPIMIGYALVPGTPDERICFVVDLTELKRAEESERAARAEVERASRLKDEFVAAVSHELRTPLNAIQGWTQLLQRPGAPPAYVAKGLAVIERNTRQLAQIVSDLLDTSRIVSGKLHVEVELVDVAELVEVALEGMRAAAEEKGVSLSASFEREGFVHADPPRLRQVVENLVSNAIKFTPAGGRVDVTLEGRPDRVVLRVRDTGQGIDPAFLPFVFDRFRQADASTARAHRGLGLGLAIVKHVVELHGGEVRAASGGSGKGAEFVVELPGATSRPLRRPRNGVRPGAARGPTGARVLVVDDEPDARELAQRILEEQGAVVVTAASAREAFDAVAARAPDVVVSDIGMPEIDGYELARRLGVPAVALTAFVRPEDKARALAAGFRAHLTKPVEPDELVAAVARLRAS